MQEQSKKIYIHDITAREAAQSPGDPNKPETTVEDKIRYFKDYVVPLNVDAFEGFYPSSNEGEFYGAQQVAQYAKENNIQMAIVGLCRAMESDVKKCWKAIKEAPIPRIHTYITLSERGLEELVHKNFDEAVTLGCHAIKYAKSISNGKAQVQFSIEHFGDCIGNEEQIAQAIIQFIDAGADIINLPNTVERTTPNKFARFVENVVSCVKRKRPDSNTKFSVHCHNDKGTATATVLACLETGVIDCVETAVAPSLGERAGNTSMPEVIVGIDENPEFGRHQIKCDKIYDTAQAAGEIFHRPVPSWAPVVGSDIWTTSSGTHGRGVSSNENGLGIYVPFDGGRYHCPNPQTVFSSQSGTDILMQELRDSGHPIFKESAKVILPFAKEVAAQSPNRREVIQKLCALGAIIGAYEKNNNHAIDATRVEDIKKGFARWEKDQAVVNARAARSITAGRM